MTNEQIYLKFRIWDVKKNDFADNGRFIVNADGKLNQIKEYGTCIEPASKDEYILSYGANILGVDLYDGDIIKLIGGEYISDTTATVRFGKGESFGSEWTHTCFGFWLNFDNEYDAVSWDSIENHHKIKIIGNVFKNNAVSTNDK